MNSRPKQFRNVFSSSAIQKLSAQAALAAVVCLPTVAVAAAAKPRPQAAAEVQKTLAAEAEGETFSRDERLARLIESAPDYAPARWAAGFVEDNGKWMKYDSPSGGYDSSEKLADYRRVRDGAADTALDHAKLANWCHQHGLKDQERTHLLRVLDFEPNRADLRPRAPLIHIALAGDTIVASGGHPFWVAGQGWVNARHLTAEMLIHTVTGTTPVETVDVEEDAEQPVYNLVVEDFHNYFAGNSHLLLHDITPREPTLGPVPGWRE